MVEIPLWSLILFLIAFFLMFIHLIIGDLLGKALYNYLKHKEEKERKDKKDGME